MFSLKGKRGGKLPHFLKPRPFRSHVLYFTLLPKKMYSIIGLGNCKIQWNGMLHNPLLSISSENIAVISCCLQTSGLQWMMVPLYRPVLLVLLYLLSWWRGQQAVGSSSPLPPPPPPPLPPFIGAADDSFSGIISLILPSTFVLSLPDHMMCVCR